MVSYEEYSKEYYLTDYKLSSWYIKVLKYIKALIEFYFVEYNIIINTTGRDSDITAIKSIFREDYNSHFSVINDESETTIGFVKRLRFIRNRDPIRFSYVWMRMHVISRVDLSKIKLESTYYIFHCVTEPIEYLLFCEVKKLGLKTLGWQHAYYQRTNLFFDRVFSKVYTDGYIYFSENVTALIDKYNPVALKYFRWYPPNDLVYDYKMKPLLLLDHPVNWRSNFVLVIIGLLRGFKLRFHPKNTILCKMFNNSPLKHGNIVVGYKSGFLKHFEERGCLVHRINSPFGLISVNLNDPQNLLITTKERYFTISRKLHELKCWMNTL